MDEVYDYRLLDSTLLSYIVYQNATVETLYTFNQEGDTLLSITESSPAIIPDSIREVLRTKEAFKQAMFIRKNDYPAIKKLLSPIPMDESLEPVFTIVEDPPEFPGGTPSLSKFLSYFLEYPEAARIQGISGRVEVKFTIEKDGTINDLSVIKSLGYGCDEAALNAVRKLPDWKPGYQRGRPVSVDYILPFNF